MDKVKHANMYKNLPKELINIIKTAARAFPPKTKFRSLFGAIDIVSDKDEIKVDGFGDVYVLGISGGFRIIYNGSYWADVIQKAPIDGN